MRAAARGPRSRGSARPRDRRADPRRAWSETIPERLSVRRSESCASRRTAAGSSCRRSLQHSAGQCPGTMVTSRPAAMPAGTRSLAKLGAWPVPSRSASTSSGVPSRPVSQVARTSATASRSSAARRLNRRAIDLRHPRGRGAGAGRIGEDMAVDDAELADHREIVRMRCFALGRKAGDQVGADGDVRAAPAQRFDQSHRIVRACRRFIRLRIRSSPIAATGGHAASPAVRRRSAPTAADRSRSRRARTGADGEGGECGEDRPDQRARRGRPSVRAPRGEVDPGQHHFVNPGIDAAGNLGEHVAMACDRLGPRPAGSRRRCSARSQPSCTWTKARVAVRPGAPSPAAARGAFQARGSSLALLATRPSTSGIAAIAARSTSAAQPVTSSRCRAWLRRGGSPGGSGAWPRRSPRSY